MIRIDFLTEKGYNIVEKTKGSAEMATVDYVPPYQITDRMLMLVSSISENIGQITYIQEHNNRPHLRKNSKIKSVYSSLKIETSPFALEEVRDIIDGHPVLGKQREIQEVKNAYEAYDRIQQIDPYSLDALNELHGIMTKYLVKESGRFRSGNEGVFQDGKCIFMAPPPELVPDLMQKLFDWMNASKDVLHPLILSAVFHYEFVFIHPYEDGNGRMARLWHTAILTKWKPIFEYIPIESQIERFQQRYYDAIAKCHANGNSNLFIEFMLEQIDSISNEILLQSKKKDRVDPGTPGLN